MAVVLWMTGYSGSGKTTIARELKNRIKNSVVLDGDMMRSGLCRDLGFSIKDREENIKRIAYVARVIKENDINVIVPVMTPTNNMRNLARGIIGRGFILIYIDCPFDVCESRHKRSL